MATLISSIHIGIGKLLVQKSFLPDDVVVNLGSPEVQALTGTVIKTDVAPTYPVGSIVAYYNSGTQITVAGIPYTIIDESKVIFGMPPAV